MTAWLSSILGVVVVGVVVELLTQNRRMGQFIRSIYSFIVLLVIIAPLPNLLKKDWWSDYQNGLVNTELLEQINQNSKQAQVVQTLRVMGYQQALVTVVDNVIYVNLGVTVDETTLHELQNKLGVGVIIV